MTRSVILHISIAWHRPRCAGKQSIVRRLVLQCCIALHSLHLAAAVAVAVAVAFSALLRQGTGPALSFGFIFRAWICVLDLYSRRSTSGEREHVRELGGGSAKDADLWVLGLKGSTITR